MAAEFVECVIIDMFMAGWGWAVRIDALKGSGRLLGTVGSKGWRIGVRVLS